MPIVSASFNDNKIAWYENSPSSITISPPNEFILSVGSGGPEISWQASPDQDISQYVIFGGSTASNLTEITTVSASETSYSPAKDTSGFYAIKAENSTGVRSELVGPVSYVNSSQEVDNQWQLVGNNIQNEIELDNIKAFGFKGAYHSASTLSSSSGSWIKSSETQSFELRGKGLEFDTLQLDQGWNLVGSLADTGSVEDINKILDPTPIYRYDSESGSYEEVDKFHPGEGHWIYSIEAGSLPISIDSPLYGQEKRSKDTSPKEQKFDKIVFRTNAASQSFFYVDTPLSKAKKAAYRLPPKVPSPKLDVRTPKRIPNWGWFFRSPNVECRRVSCACTCEG